MGFKTQLFYLIEQIVKSIFNKKFLFVSSLTYLGGTVIVYNRPSNSYPWTFLQSITIPTGFSDVNGIENFGITIDISEDSKILVIGAPDVGGVRTQFRGVYSPTTIYAENDIVKYNNKLYIKVIPDLDGGLSNSVGDSLADAGDSVTLSNNIADGGYSDTAITNSTAWELLTQVYEVSYGQTRSSFTRQGTVFVYNFKLSERQFVRDSFVYAEYGGYLLSREQIICSYNPTSNERFGRKVSLIIWLSLWLIYLSFVNVGQIFYGYGWT